MVFVNNIILDSDYHPRELARSAVLQFGVNYRGPGASVVGINFQKGVQILMRLNFLQVIFYKLYAADGF